MSSIRQMLPAGKKQLLAQVLDYTGLNYLLNTFSSWSGLLVLNYHRIGNPDGVVFERNIFSATAEELERQVVLFQKHADIVGIDDLEEVNRSQRGKHILLTFDDGYRDNYELAFPVLRDCRAKATFFIATGLIDQPRVAWWDEIAWMMQNANVNVLPANPWFSEEVQLEHGYPQEAIGKAVRAYWSLKNEQTESFLNDLAALTGSGRSPQSLAAETWMTWDMIREMSAAGQDIGGHTVNHPILAQCSVTEQREEIAMGRKRLTEMLGQAPTAFAYPVGQAHMFSSDTEKILEESGYRWGFSFYGNYSTLPVKNRYDIPRCAVDYGQPVPLLRARLTLPQIFSKK